MTDIFFARGRHYGAEQAIRQALLRISILARSAKWPTGLYILLALIYLFYVFVVTCSVSLHSLKI